MARDSGLPKWLIALAVGAPLTVALGYYYYRKKNIEEASDKNGSVKPKTGAFVSKDADLSPTTPSPTAPLTPLERVLNLKNSGNEFFKKRKMEDAIKCYSEAISICPPEEESQLSVLYQNRAACYESLNDLESLMKDINRSLELNPKYVKALTRRYKAAERLQRYRLCIEDLTTLCLLEQYSNMETLSNADRILKIIGQEESKEAVTRRVPSNPSSHFIKSYFASFSQDPVISDIDSSKVQSGDTPLVGLDAAKVAYAEDRFGDIIARCDEQLEREGAQRDDAYYQALLLRASLHILRTDYDRALKDISTIVDARPNNVKITVNALVKRASLYLQLENEVKCFEDFETAISLDPTNSDIYHHRGQIYMLLDKIDDSLNDFDTAYRHNPNSDLLVAQRLYTRYRSSLMKGETEATKSIVEELKRVADKRKCVGGEAALLLAQIYLDQQDFDSAEKYFNKALEDDPKNGTILVHKGLLELQWHQDVNKAVEYMERAIQVDPLLEFSYETLATVEVQRGQMERAIELFDKALTLSKGEREMAHICSLKAAAETQLRMSKRLGLAPLSLQSV